MLKCIATIPVFYYFKYIILSQSTFFHIFSYSSTESCSSSSNPSASLLPSIGFFLTLAIDATVTPSSRLINFTPYVILPSVVISEHLI